MSYIKIKDYLPPISLAILSALLSDKLAIKQHTFSKVSYNVLPINRFSSGTKERISLSYVLTFPSKLFTAALDKFSNKTVIAL